MPALSGHFFCPSKGLANWLSRDQTVYNALSLRGYLGTYLEINVGTGCEFY